MQGMLAQLFNADWLVLVHHPPMLQEIDEERRLKRSGAEREENERHAMAINAQIERARKVARREEIEAPAGTELRKDEHGEPLKLSLAPSTAGELLRHVYGKDPMQG
eukprot:1160787-Pelagomonas_calceolata.AAC.9